MSPKWVVYGGVDAVGLFQTVMLVLWVKYLAFINRNGQFQYRLDKNPGS